MSQTRLERLKEPLQTSRTFRMIRAALPRIVQFLTKYQEILNTLKNCRPTTRKQVRLQ